MKTLLILLSMIMASCSAPKQETGASFKVGMRSLAATADTASEFPGGLMLYGVSGERSFGRVMTSASQDETIPNGTWDFYVLGWDGNAKLDPMTGKVYCALQKGVELNGDPVEINLVANNADCAAPAFGGVYKDANGDNHFPKVEIETCNDLAHAVDSASTCQYDTSVVPTVAKKGSAISYEISAMSFNKVNLDFQPMPDIELSSACGEVDPGAAGGLAPSNNLSASDLNIPAGSAGSPFSFVLKAYTASDKCDDNFGFHPIPMFTGAAPNNPSAKTVSVSAEINKIFAKTTLDDVCALSTSQTDAGAAIAPFSGGRGTNGSPYVICNGGELNQIGSTYVAESFILGQDIDMNPYTAALGDGVSPPCAEEGENFYPIGGYSSTCGGSGSPYTGVLDGANHLVKGLRVGNENESQVGFIRSLAGSLLNIKFEMLEIDGAMNVGVVGYMDDGSNIYNIEINEGRVEAINGSVGSVAGSAGNTGSTIIELARVNDVGVSSDGGDAGGILGSAYGSPTLQKVAFKGYIDSHQEGGALGGIAGNLPAGASVYEAVSSGAISGQASSVGGIVGSSGAITLNNFYSNMLLNSNASATAASIGAYIGFDGGSTFSKGYFSGIILCDSCVYGYVFGDGSGTPSYNTLYTHNNLDDGSVTATGFSYKTDAVLSGNSLNALGDGSIWINPANGHPRLAFEKPDACDSNTTSDKVICTVDELQSFLSADNGVSGEEYLLGESLNVGSLTPGILKDILDGQGNAILNAKWSGTGVSGGLFSDIQSSGAVKNLSLMGANFADTTATQVGLLAKVNDGLIENVNVQGMISAESYLGTVVYKNNGVIRKTRASGAITGKQYLGGLAAENTGQIVLSEADTSIVTPFSGSLAIGGLVALNGATGSISKSMTRPRIDTISMPSSPFLTNGVIGGLVAANDGSIDNCMVEGGEISLMGANAANVGGFVGENSGSVLNSFSMAYVRIEDQNTASTFGGFVGNDVNGGYSGSLYGMDPVFKFVSYNPTDTPRLSGISCTGTNSLQMDLLDQDTRSFNIGDVLAVNESSYQYTYSLSATAAFSASLSTTFSINEACMSPGTVNSVDVLRIYNAGGNGGLSITSETSLMSLQTYIDAGWDVGEIKPDGTGHNQDRLLDYFKAILTGADTVPEPPVWEFHNGEPPRLVELDM